jgi:hypothetical protein
MYARMAVALAGAGHAVLSLSVASDLTERLHAVVDAERPPWKPDEWSDGDPDEEALSRAVFEDTVRDEAHHMIIGERVILRDGPLAATVHRLDAIADTKGVLPLTLPGAAPVAHLHIAVNRYRRLTENYILSADARLQLAAAADNGVVCALRSSRLVGTTRVISAVPLPTREAMRAVLEGTDLPVVASVATSAAGTRKWAERWSDFFSAVPRSLFVFDTPPHRAFYSWKHRGVGARWMRGMPVPRDKALTAVPPCYVTIVIPDLQPRIPYVAITSHVTGEALASVAARLWGPSDLGADTTAIWGDAGDLAQLHVLLEEAIFDFRFGN